MRSMPRKKNLGMRVVLDVTKGLRDRNVTCDNFFTSYELGQQLLKRKMTMPKGRAVFSSKFAFTSTTAAVSYVPKKNVLLVSTKHMEAKVSDRCDRKPVIILDYNRCKGGVDNLDKVIGTYSCRRRAVSRSRTRGEGKDAEVSEAAGAASGEDDPTRARKRKRCQFCPQAKDNKTSTVCSGYNTVSVNDDDYCEKESDEREEGSRRSDEHKTARDLTSTSDHDVDFYRDTDSPRSRYEYDDYRSDTAELDVEGHFSEDEAWENNPDEDFVDQRELFNHSDEHQTPRDLKGTSDHDADFYRDSNSPRSRHEYDDYDSDTAELEVEGHFSEDEAWRNTPDEEYDRRGLLSERHVEGDIVEDEEYYPYSDSLGTPGDTEDTSEADLPRNSFMDQSELLNDEICIVLWDCDEEVEEEFGSNNRYASTCCWTELQESWKSFVSWLGERWWGSVSEESVRTFMDTSERRRIGDIVVSARFGDMPGGVCSFTVKTESGLLSFPLLIRQRCYVCADLVEGDFSCPIDMLRKLARETYTHLLPRPTTIPSNPQYFSLTRVVDDMCSVLDLLKSGWCDVSQPHRIIEYLQNKEGPSVNPAALICCVDDDSPGYLFEIIDAKGKRLKVTFNKLGFTFGSGLHFSGLTSLLSHICEVDGVNFVINCRFLPTASELERPM
ncbi:uncharacterized protein LOC123485190 [Xyrichtys novacula]|uniref:Uncharacterized protein LOC123485190 n=1 Tax=Xyrichtys novacula TaxID=13765 RepID=A0AAV1FKH7_XYRNO|nr:uncharacterized protein LOC123485190 [Xyrichtys novacula]